MNTIRQVIAYKRYFLDFYESQIGEVQKKIEWTLNLLRTIERVPKKYFDHMTGTNGLFEVRVGLGGNILYSHSWNLVVLGNGFQKKTSKTPKGEIEKALKIKEEYENEK